MATRIDIAISEQGTSVVTRKLEGLASSTQRLSPKVAASLRAKALRLGLNTDKLTKQVAVAALEAVVHTTPHDTGQARANWQVKIAASKPATHQLQETDYDGYVTVAKGALTILTTKREMGQIIFITNALPYIQRLNEGWSQQAAAGFVERGVQAGARVARNGVVL